MGGRGCLVRGIPRCCSPSAPGKEREKEGEFFFFPDWLKMDTNVLVWRCVCVSVCVQGKDVEKGKNIEDSGHKRDAPS